MTKFKKIKNFDDYYVSQDGYVYSEKLGKRKKLKPRINRGGYFYVNLSKNGKYKSKTVHRLVADAFLTLIEGKNQVNHIDGNKLNNKTSNLEFCTKRENMLHAVKLGLLNLKYGKDNHNSKLSKNDRRKIKELYFTGNFTHKQIAEKFNVNRSTITNCINNKTYLKQKMVGSIPTPATIEEKKK